MNTPLRTLKRAACAAILSAFAFAAHADTTTNIVPIASSPWSSTAATAIEWTATNITTHTSVATNDLYSVDNGNGKVEIDTGDATLTYTPTKAGATTTPASTEVSLQFSAAATAPAEPDGAQTAITVFIANGATNYYVYATTNANDSLKGWTVVPNDPLLGTFTPNTTSPVDVTITIDYEQEMAFYVINGVYAGGFDLANVPADKKISSLNFAGSGYLSGNVVTKAAAAASILPSGVGSEVFYETVADANSAYNTSGGSVRIWDYNSTTKWTAITWESLLGNAVSGAYEIDNLAELKAFQNGVAIGLPTAGITFKLTSDITLDAAWPGIGIQNGKDLVTGNATDVAEYEAGAFQGTFDGQDHTISQFQMVDGLDYCGLFNSVKDATIKNLKISYKNGLFAENTTTGSGESGATFVGVAKASTLTNLTTIAGTVSCSKGFGGIVGYLMGGTTVDSCTNNVNLTSLMPNKAGGIAMITQNGSGNAIIRNCQNNGTTTGSNETGSFVGYIGHDTTIDGCASTVDCKLMHHQSSTVTVQGVNTASGLVSTNSYTGAATPGLNFATVDDGVATFVADNALAAGDTYKVMASGATATYQLANAGDTITFDTSLFTPTYAITGDSGLVVEPDTTVANRTTYKAYGTMTVTATGYNGTYDGEAHEASAECSQSGATITWKVGDGEFSSTVPSITDVGTQTVVAKATKENYKDATSETVTLTVTAASMTVTATGYSGTYDGEAHEASAECSQSGATITWKVGNGEFSSTVPSIKDVGTQTVVAKATKANYNDATSEAVTLTVTAKALTLTADNKSIGVGEAAPTYTYTTSGLVGGDALTDNPTLSCDYEQGDAVGNYTIVLSDGTASANYAISRVNGTLTVTNHAHTLTITYEVPQDFSAPDTYSHSYNYGDSYSVASPAVTGCTPNVDTVEGTMGSADINVTVTYSVNTYTIYWVADDGSTNSSTTVAYGQIPSHDGIAKAGDGKYEYVWAGWDPTPDYATATTAYTATYTTVIVNPLTLALNTNATLNAVSAANQTATVNATLAGAVSGVAVSGDGFAVSGNAVTGTFTGIDWNAATNWAATASQGSGATAETSTLAGRVYAKAEAPWFSTNVVDGSVTGFGDIEDGIDLSTVASAAGQMARINTRLTISGASSEVPQVGEGTRGGLSVLKLDGDATASYYAYAVTNGTDKGWVKLSGATPSDGEHDILIAVDTASNEAFYYADGVSLYIEGTPDVYAIQIDGTANTISAIGFANPEGVTSVVGEYDVPYAVAIDTTGYTANELATARSQFDAGQVITVLTNDVGGTITLGEGESVEIVGDYSGKPGVAGAPNYKVVTSVGPNGGVLYEAVLDVATVYWVSENGATTNYSKSVTIGQFPVYEGDVAGTNKASTAQYNYTFAGWAATAGGSVVDPLPAVAAGGATYYAVFTPVLRSYTITWKNADGTTIDTTDVEYGTVPTHADASKDADETYRYEFAAWSPTPIAVVGEATYAATFTPTYINYTITWNYKAADGTAASSVVDNAHYGDALTPPSVPATYVADGKIYTFTDAWSPALTQGATVTGNASYTAQYDNGTAAKATVLSVAEDGGVVTTNVVGTYASLAEAVGAAKDGDTVVLLANDSVTTGITIPADKAITIDLDGKTVTATTAGTLFTNNGGLTLKNGTITSTGDFVDNYGVLTIESGTYTTDSWGIANFSGAETYIRGGSITALEQTMCCFRDNSIFEMTGGTLASTCNAVIATHGTAGRSNNVVRVLGGTITASMNAAGAAEGYTACGIYVANDDKVTVSNVAINVTNGAGIVARAGNVEILDETVITTTGNTTGKVGDSRVVVPCAAVVFDSAAGYPGYDSNAATVTIEGGTFVSQVTTVQLVGDDEVVSIPVGSTAQFSDANADGVPEGYALKEVPNSVPTMYALAQTFVVTYANYDGAALQVTTNFVGDTTPAYAGTTPVKPSAGGYDYTFAGAWLPAVDETVTSNATYTAQFDASATPTVILITDNGTTTNYFATLQAALDDVKENNLQQANIELLADASIEISRNGNVLGGNSTTNITINGNNHELHVVRDGTWAQFNTANDATLVLNDVSLTSEFTGTQTGWVGDTLQNPNHNIAFNCDVELNDVTSTTALSFWKDADLDTVTIAETVDVYSIWIHTTASNIAIKDLVVNSPTGRGIKVDDSFVKYAGAPSASTAISIDGASFTTKNKKSAVLVRSAYPIAVTATGTIDITNVPADTQHLVWVDEDASENFGLVSFNGAQSGLGVEGGASSYAASLTTNSWIAGYYKVLADAVDDATADDTLTLQKTVTETFTVSKALTITRNGFSAENVTAGEGYERTVTDAAYVFAEAAPTPEGAASGTVVILAADDPADEQFTVTGISVNGSTVTINFTAAVYASDAEIASTVFAFDLVYRTALGGSDRTARCEAKVTFAGGLNKGVNESAAGTVVIDVSKLDSAAANAFFFIGLDSATTQEEPNP